MEKPILQILSDLSKIPNVSYYEQEVGNYIYKKLREFVDKIYFDDFGNLIAHKKGINDSAPSFAFVSHMDHPGFEVIACNNSTYTLKTMGGVSKYAGAENNSLILIDENNKIPITVTKKPEITSEFNLKREKDGWLGNDVIFSTLDYDLDNKNFQVIFDLEDFFIDKKTNLIHMRSADDLAGCSSIMQALINLSNQNIQGDFFGIFTRAEEVGLLGSAALAESQIIPLETNIISVETSSIIPGVNLSDGVIIRTGDRISTFNNSTEKFLIYSADNLQNKNKKFKYQRQLMSAGGCEASAFKAFGYKVSGLAYPLGNWHNRGAGKIEEEYISVFDLLSGQSLIEEVAKFSSTISDNLNEKFRQSLIDQDGINRLRQLGSPKGI